MRIETTNVKKIIISDLENLDPISLYVEDHGKGRGEITITCFSDSWSYYWGAIGERDVIDFVLHCDNHYLSSKLNPHIESTVLDEEALENFVKSHIIEQRRECLMDKKTARELWHKCKDLEEYRDTDRREYSEILHKIFGSEWYDYYPTKPNPKYQYFCRILDSIKEALRELKEKQTKPNIYKTTGDGVHNLYK